MTKTLLAKKANQVPIATDDVTYEQLAADTTISEFPQGSDYSMYTKMHNNVIQQTGDNMNYNNTQAGDNAAQNGESLVKADEGWVNKKWRPAMGWMYMAVCITDFILFPILWAVVQFWETEAVNDAFRQWQPLTLQGAGLFHIAMGAVLGIAVYGRTKEKLDSKN